MFGRQIDSFHATAQAVTSGTCGMSSLGFNTQNRITNPGFSYDAAGNMIAETGRTYQYDAENRMKTVNNGAIGTYTYDADGRRVRKVAGSTTTDYIYDLAGSVVAEKQGSTWTVGYIYVNGQLTAQYKDSTTYFVHKDHLGSTRLMTKLDQSVHDSLDYLPYGEQVAGDTGSTHKFTGKERDAESGLDYFGARYYASSWGSFTTSDPQLADWQRLVDPQQLNMYAYARGNPLRFGDDTGEEVIEKIITKTYEVHGKTAAEAMDNAKKTSGMRSEDGEAMTGMTKANMTATDVKADGVTVPNLVGGFFSEVKVESANVNLEQTTTTPEWSERDQAPAEEQQAWDKSMQDLKEHEAGHQEINREAAQKADSSLPGARGSATGQTPQEAVDKATKNAVQPKVDRATQQANEQNKEYDKKTDHGRKPDKPERTK